MYTKQALASLIAGLIYRMLFGLPSPVMCKEPRLLDRGFFEVEGMMRIELTMLEVCKSLPYPLGYMPNHILSTPRQWSMHLSAFIG